MMRRQPLALQAWQAATCGVGRLGFGMTKAGVRLTSGPLPGQHSC